VIERLTQGAVTVHDLRPDVFGPPPLAGEGS
jgi:DNA-binding transcriptional regulator YdaS (Cro superfamily)